MKKVLLGLAVLYVGFANAQSEVYSGSSYGFQVEYVDFQRGQFNTYLDSKSLPKGSLPQFMYGFNLNGKYKQHIMGVDYSSNNTVDAQQTFRVKNSLFTVAINYGYSVLKNDKWDLYPYLGYRLLNYGYQFEGFLQESNNFEGYLTQNKAYVNLENRMHGADVGIGFSYNGSLAYNVKVGTQLPYVSRRWKEVSTEDKLEGGPHVKSLIYVKVSLGFGDYKSKSGNSLPAIDKSE